MYALDKMLHAEQEVHGLWWDPGELVRFTRSQICVYMLFFFIYYFSQVAGFFKNYQAFSRSMHKSVQYTADTLNLACQSHFRVIRCTYIFFGGGRITILQMFLLQLLAYSKEAIADCWVTELLYHIKMKKYRTTVPYQDEKIQNYCTISR